MKRLLTLTVVMLLVACGEKAPESDSSERDHSQQRAMLESSTDLSSSELGDGGLRSRYRINNGVVQLDKVGPDGVVSLVATASGDMNGDGREDHAAVLVLNSAGSGIFYYLNVLLRDEHGGWYFLNEQLLGDRLVFDFMAIYQKGSTSQVSGVPIHLDDYGQLVVGYSAHDQSQPFSDPPARYLTKHWKVGGDALVLLENY